MQSIERVRTEITRLMGPLPQRVELQPETISREDCGAYIREKVEYFVEKDERIAAWILIPKTRNERTPALFCHHQHNMQFHLGKNEVVGLAGDPDQAYAAELAERGYITFAPDAIAFEERNWDGGSSRPAYWELATRLVKGETLLAKALHDIRIGTDYLLGRPEVDTDRVGFIGHSYGGRMALWAPAFDKRIKTSVSNCGCVNYKDSLSHESGIQMEYCVPGILNVADVEDMVRMIAPRPLLIMATTDDVWSKGAQEMYEYAKPDFPDGQLELRIFEGGHKFTQDMREVAYAFIERELRTR